MKNEIGKIISLTKKLEKIGLCGSHIRSITFYEQKIKTHKENINEENYKNHWVSPYFNNGKDHYIVRNINYEIIGYLTTEEYDKLGDEE